VDRNWAIPQGGTAPATDPTTPATHRHGIRRAAGAFAMLTAVAVCAALPAPAGAEAAGGTAIRVAHFSIDTPAMDIYATGFDGNETLVLPKLGFGEVSEYLPLDAGIYAFSMRPAGSPATSEAVLRVSAELDGDTSYTFAAFGHQAELATDLLTDDLSAPSAGRARVRLIQGAADAGAVDVVTDGPLLAHGAALGTVGDYVSVAAGSWEVTASGEDGARLVERLDLEAGTVSSVVVLDEPTSGGLQLVSVTDAAGADAGGQGAAAPAGMPAGGVDTGGGAMAADRTSTTGHSGVPLPWLVLGSAAGLGVTAAVLGGIWRRTA
jgi:Domain of unknown function (DUF4397)